MKKILVALTPILLIACGVQNNITFSTQSGSCSDGTDLYAPYCMAITIQNNNGGQNYINSTNFPISNLSLSVSGPGNVGYPTTPGSTYDPNNCLGSNIGPGQGCTFYLWLNGESAPVGSKVPINITANYTINNTMPWATSTNTASSSLTVYETPNLLITGSTGTVQSYANGQYNSSIYTAESGETNVNSVTNDNYYGFLYIAGQNGIYYSGNGSYVSNASIKSGGLISGATNVMVNGQNLYGAPYGTSSTTLSYAGIAGESFTWSSYQTGLSSSGTQNGINAISGGNIFLATAGVPSIYYCGVATSGNGCNQEGPLLQESGVTNITALGYTTLGSVNGNTLTGVVVGTNGGLWVESGVLRGPSNGWLQVNYTSSTQPDNPLPINRNIVSIASDITGNLYIADGSGYVYYLPIGSSNVATYMDSWSTLLGKQILAMVMDNSGQSLYVATSGGYIYSCAINGACKQLSSPSAFTGNGGNPSIKSLNIVTSLTSS